MSANGAAVSVPTWTDVKFFEKVLTLSQGDKTIKVKSLGFHPVAKQNDSLSSVIFRAQVDYSSKQKADATISVIVKTTPFEEGAKKDLLSKMPFFDTEISMYQNTLSEMERVFKAAGEPQILAPGVLYQSFEPAPVIVLEDIAQRGYEMLTSLLKLDEAYFVMTRLAKFHAASFYLHANNEDVTRYKHSLFAESNAITNNLFKDNFDLFIGELKLLSGNEIYIDKLEKMKTRIVELGAKLYAPNKGDDGYNVLNHGDFHNKNVMVTRKDGKLDDLILLDYQISVYASPAIDIIYGLYMMIDSHVRLNHRDALIAHYYKEFDGTLKKLGFLGKVPTYQELLTELLKKGTLEIIIGVCMLPFFFIDFTTIDVEEFFSREASEVKKSFFKNADYQEVMKKELPRFLNKGFFN